MGTFPHRHNPSAQQDCFVFERPQVVFYCNFSCSRHVSKSANLIGRIVFDAAVSNKKNEPEAFKKMTLLRMAFFVSVYTLTLARNSSRCERVFTVLSYEFDIICSFCLYCKCITSSLFTLFMKESSFYMYKLFLFTKL